MIETLAEAAHTFGRPDYYLAAEAAAQFILNDMIYDDNLHRISYLGRSSIEAQLVDYASLGLAFISLHDFASNAEGSARWLTHAEDMANAMMLRFSEADGSFRMTEQADGLGAFRPLDDGEIPGGNGMALALFSALAERVENPDYLRRTNLLTAAISGNILNAPEQRAYSINAIQKLTFGSTGPVRFAANGAVRIAAHHDRDTQLLTLNLTIKDGWHINAHIPLEDYFIPTDLLVNGDSIGPDGFSEPLLKSLGFSNEPLALYQDELVLSAEISPDSSYPARASLILQACSDAICLAPQEVKFTLW